MKRTTVTKGFAIALVTAIAMAFSRTPVSADQTYPIKVTLNGSEVDFVDTHAQIIHDSTYVPVARIIDILTGVWPQWDDNTKSASFTYNGSNYRIVTTQNGIYKNNVLIPYEIPSEIRNDRVLIPLRMLSNALGFEINWNGETRVVSLKSPAPAPTPTPAPTPVPTPAPTPTPALVTVNAIDPLNTRVTAGNAVTVKVTASSNAVEVKLVDSGNRTVANTTTYISVSGGRQFTLTFYPTAGGKYRAYAATSSGYNNNSYREMDLTIGTGATVNSVSVSQSKVKIGDYAVVTVNASLDTTRVRLVSDSNSNDAIESTNYTTSGDQRIFRLDWLMQDGYYSGRSSASAKIYAGDSSGYATAYKSVTVNIEQSTPPVIYNAYASPSEIDTNSQAYIYVNTSTNVTNISFQGSGGNLRDRTLTRYSDSGGQRRWETVYYAGSQAMYDMITVTAYTSSGTSVGGTVTITVKSAQPEYIDAEIYSIDSSTDWLDVSTGQSIEFNITTGPDASAVTVYDDFTSRAVTARQTGNYGGSKYWSVTVQARTSEGWQSFVFSTAGPTGMNADERTQDIYASGASGR